MSTWERAEFAAHLTEKEQETRNIRRLQIMMSMVMSVISQDVNLRDFNLTPQNQHLQMARWVTTTGGDYFFSPSITTLKDWGSSD